MHRAIIAVVLIVLLPGAVLADQPARWIYPMAAASAGGTEAGQRETKDENENNIEILALGLIFCGALLTASGWEQTHPRDHCTACENLELAGKLELASGIVLIFSGVLAM